jgi:hypothetical protein
MALFGMRVVVDTNRLQSEELRVFLARGVTNRAVIPEHTVAEIFKPNSVDSVIESFCVLRDFPKQVLILNSNRKIAPVSPRGAALADRYIDRQTTRKLPAFFSLLANAEIGDEGYRRQLSERRKWAIERVQMIESSFGDQGDSLAELSAMFTDKELNQFRAGQPIRARARQVILEVTNQTASRIHRIRTDKPLYPAPYLYYHFSWRYALCHVIQLMELIRVGSVRRAPAKARNDHFDNVFATFGTYFNGLMTDDRGSLLTQHFARIILRNLNVRLAADYVESEYILQLLDEVEGSK